MLVASRTLKLREGKEEILIPIRIFAPKEAAGGSWFCHFEIDWPGEHQKMDIGGADSVQSLVLALQTIGAVIYSSNYHKAGQLFVDELGNGYGFPVMSNMRDLLQGEDAKYL